MISEIRFWCLIVAYGIFHVAFLAFAYDLMMWMGGADRSIYHSLFGV
jgi:hypothetical protein